MENIHFWQQMRSFLLTYSNIMYIIDARLMQHLWQNCKWQSWYQNVTILALYRGCFHTNNDLLALIKIYQWSCMWCCLVTKTKADLGSKQTEYTVLLRGCNHARLFLRLKDTSCSWISIARFKTGTQIGLSQHLMWCLGEGLTQTRVEAGECGRGLTFCGFTGPPSPRSVFTR